MKKMTLVFLACLVLILAGIGVWVYSNGDNQLPREITRQVTFDIYYPDNIKQNPVSKDSAQYNPETKVFSYTTVVAGNKVTINQQDEPEIFNEADVQVSLYQKLLEKMRQYKEIETNLGTVTLTRPEELKGKQAAVLNAGGTLLFAEPESDLADNQWQQFFDSLVSL